MLPANVDKASKLCSILTSVCVTCAITVTATQADLLVNARVRVACELMDGSLALPGQGS